MKGVSIPEYLTIYVNPETFMEFKSELEANARFALDKSPIRAVYFKRARVRPKENLSKSQFSFVEGIKDYEGGWYA